MSSDLLKIAWRNLGRNRRRTVITGFALAAGTALSIGTYGIMDGMSADMLHALTRFDLGHLQVHHPDFPRQRTLKFTIPDASRVIDAARAQPRIEAVSARIHAYALISRKDKSAGVQIIGIDPAQEQRITEMHRQVTAGRFLPGKPTDWPRGRQLSAAEKRLDEQLTDQAEAAVLAELDRYAEGQAPEGAGEPEQAAPAPDRTLALANKLSPPPRTPPPVFVGAALARVLRARVGDELYALGYTVDGMTEEVPVRVVGIFETGTDSFDRSRIYMHLVDAQRFSHLYDRVHEIAMVVPEPGVARQTAAALRQRLGDRGLLVRSWDEIRPDIQGILQLNDAWMVVTVFVILLISAVGVVNTMLMAVLERTREIGVLKALGMRGVRVVKMIVLEALLLALASALVGMGLGYLLDLYLVHYGIDLRSMTEGFSIGGMGLDPVLRGEINLRGFVIPVIVLAFSCLIASLYPAIRAARLRPAVGMRDL